jgi:hypothetical protein
MSADFCLHHRSIRITEPPHLVVRDWQGCIVYEGPAPVPEELVTLSFEDVLAGRLYTYDVTRPS